nr:hypothetical protein [Sphingopyxis sp.]
MAAHRARMRRYASYSHNSRARSLVLVDTDKPRMIGIAARHRMVLQLAETFGERHMIGPFDRLIAQEQHLMFKQCGADLGEKIIVVRRLGEIDSRRSRRRYAW